MPERRCLDALQLHALSTLLRSRIPLHARFLAGGFSLWCSGECGCSEGHDKAQGENRHQCFHDGFPPVANGLQRDNAQRHPLYGWCYRMPRPECRAQGWELVSARPPSDPNTALAKSASDFPPMRRLRRGMQREGRQPLAALLSFPCLWPTSSPWPPSAQAIRTRFSRCGLVPMRNDQLGHMTAVHLRTSLATPQQQSKHRARRALRGFFSLWYWARISGDTSPGCLPINSPSSPG